MQRVLMTGAAGGVAGMIRAQMQAIYPGLVLSDHKRPQGLAEGTSFRPADLADLAAVETAVEGVEGILHLGGFSVEGPWDRILQANIVGCYNVFEAARRKGVKRIVFASSGHAMGFYPRHGRPGVDAVPRPDSRYGASKVFGEAMGALYADKHGIGVMSIRIGHVLPRPIDRRRLAIWLHPEDLVQLVRIGLEHPKIGYEVVYGASANERVWWDNTRAYELGYRPKHKAEDHVAFALETQQEGADIEGADPVADHFQGGPFCSEEYTRRS